MKRSSRLLAREALGQAAVASLLLAAAACSMPPPAPPRAAVALTLALPDALTGAACLRVTGGGAASVQLAISGASQSIQLTLDDVAAGTATFKGEVFPAACPATGVVPSWVSGPVAANLDPGRTTRVQLAVHRTASPETRATVAEDDTEEYPD
jgi:hypothetical protein